MLNQNEQRANQRLHDHNHDRYHNNLRKAEFMMNNQGLIVRLSMMSYNNR